jgi:hypothetical protein
MNFKKGIFILLLSFTGISACMAQYDYVRPLPVSSSGNYNNTFSFGFGMGGYYPYAGPSYASTPNLSAYFDRVVFKHVGPGNVSVGGMFSFKQVSTEYTNYNTTYNYIQEWNYYIIGARAAYHLNDFPFRNCNPYAGAMIAYYITGFTFTSNDPNSGEPNDPGYYLTPDTYPNFFAASVFAGISSTIGSRTCVWIEAGYGYTSLAFGASYKL